MKTALKAIFISIKKGINDALEADFKGTAIEDDAPIGYMKGGEESITFRLDGNGNSRTVFEDYGFGQTIKCTVWFVSPDTVFSFKITSDNETILESPPEVKINQHFSFKLKARTFGKTKVTVDISALAKNVDGIGKITYGF